MKPSLRRRLVVLLTGTVLLAWLATAIFTYHDAQHEIGEMLDAQLAQSASLVAAQLEHEPEEAHDTVLPRQYRHERQIAFQVWNHQGGLVLRSSSAPLDRLSATTRGFSDRHFDGVHWRVFSRLDESGHFLVQVAERYQLRDELARSVASHLLHPLYFALPALALLIWLAVSRGLAPLAALASEVAVRAPERLDALDESRTPREAMPLVTALNALFARVRQSLDRERRFTADAAHELRTPLAAIKTQAQVAQAAEAKDAREHALTQVVVGCDRATRLVEQLLMLARIDPQHRLSTAPVVDLAAMAQQVVAEFAPQALRKNIDLGLTAAPEVAVPGDAVLLAVLLRNLIDNALRYTRAGGRVEVCVATSATGATLSVADNGPGISAAERARVFERFHRVLGCNEEGSGLGLSIVARIAELHGARTVLADGLDGKGLSVSVIFSPAA